MVLLFVAMPLKYVGDMPLAVRIAGSAHGALFVWLGVLVLQGLRSRDRSFRWGMRLFVASLLTFGTFVIDRRLRAEVNAEGGETVGDGGPTYGAD